VVHCLCFEEPKVGRFGWPQNEMVGFLMSASSRIFDGKNTSTLFSFQIHSITMFHVYS